LQGSADGLGVVVEKWTTSFFRRPREEQRVTATPRILVVEARKNCNFVADRRDRAGGRTKIFRSPGPGQKKERVYRGVAGVAGVDGWKRSERARR
jgi:hypothetical protein